ncbi:glycoside hydrolase family 2 protein [Salipaludibacillus aurantiacus]|uniref:Glycosyl hydrolases family 2, TIM barrel domain n=1 Tax=Salipaludibacillus aurantiacus TaxID=1601833 RepID=A0A1H9VWE2_9BACI|nr:sugar-binding domain-containing protein [Salipaludibacillus aurantiacus]SES26076.1 Glycosyl hydrolases family 2, TIM barrel domain [Salipaludibacillus aurantiacus]
MTDRTEYPRPQFYRETWFHLNGEWNFTYDDDNRGVKDRWFEDPHFSRKIQVPFTYQTEKSGINETDFHDLVWYHRQFEFPQNWEGKQQILHFGAVDYRTWVWVNGHYAGFHEGGHVPFHFDVSAYTSPGLNEVVVRVEDETFDLTQPRGKQYWKERSEGIFYTRTTGIWQSVWMEAVDSAYITRTAFTPDVDKDEIEIAYETAGTCSDHLLEIKISFDGNLVASDTIRLNKPDGKRKILLGDFHVHDQGRLWSPEHPNLYDAEFRIKEDQRTLDKISSYFGMRKVSIENGKVMLNNKPYYMKLVLDQGYFPESLLTPPSEEAIVRDITLTKEMGFNGVRKHQKIEDPRFLYWADKKGLLVWGEMANCYMYSEDAVARMTSEWQKAIERDYSHPCIVAWVPINESWGVPKLLGDPKQQFHTLAMYYLTKSLDETRLVLSNDGWEHTKSDLCTIHDYEPEKEKLLERYKTVDNLLNSQPGDRLIYVPGYNYNGEPVQVTEFGGIAYQKSDWEGWGYSGAVNDKDFAERYEAVISAMLESPLVQGFCYTQLTDVEQEINGLLTYDRQPKIPLEVIKAINEGKNHSRFFTKEEIK